MIITILVIADKTVSLSSSENLLGLDVDCNPIGKTVRGRKTQFGLLVHDFHCF